MEQVIIERSIWINAPRERVWQAVSDPAQIDQWFSTGTAISINGDVISVHMGGMDVEVAVIEVLDPPRQLTTRSLPDRMIATTYTLEEENGGTRFTVTETGLESLSEDTRRERIQQDSAGWELALENLNAFIEGRSLPRPEGF
jgi:uncharacterized protein YndB with AHSA1/START domain